MYLRGDESDLEAMKSLSEGTKGSLRCLIKLWTNINLENFAREF